LIPLGGLQPILVSPAPAREEHYFGRGARFAKAGSAEPSGTRRRADGSVRWGSHGLRRLGPIDPSAPARRRSSSSGSHGHRLARAQTPSPWVALGDAASREGQRFVREEFGHHRAVPGGMGGYSRGPGGVAWPSGRSRPTPRSMVASREF